MTREEQHLALTRAWIDESRKRAHREIDRACAAAEAALAGQDDAARDCVRAAREVEMIAKAVRASVSPQR